MLLSTVKATIERYDLIKPGDKILVAVSGGADSVVLLEILCLLTQENRLELVIAHLNHDLRGIEAEVDAQFVASLGRKKKIRVESALIDVRAVSEEKGVGIEEAGRMARQRFLAETARAVGARVIALGHTRNDRVETLLFNLIRGAGPTGLQGIRPATKAYIRPLIDVSREEVLAFACDRGLAWREDRTNKDITYSRNWIRRKVLPLLEQHNPRVVAAVGRTADLILEEQQALEILLDRPWEKVLMGDQAGKLTFFRSKLAEFAPSIRALLIRRGIASLRGDLQGIERSHIESLCRLVSSSRAHGQADLPGINARVQGDELALSTQPPKMPPPYEFPLELGKTELPSLEISVRLSIERRDKVQLSSTDQTVEVADVACVRFPLCLRSRQPGDRFCPLGMNEEKKLKNFLIDEHVPFYERSRLPLLCDKEKILWVVGVRLSNAVRVSSETDKVLIMRVERL